MYLMLGLAVRFPSLASFVVPLSILIIVILVGPPVYLLMPVFLSKIWYEIYLSGIFPHHRIVVPIPLCDRNNQPREPRFYSLLGMQSSVCNLFFTYARIPHSRWHPSCRHRRGSPLRRSGALQSGIHQMDVHTCRLSISCRYVSWSGRFAYRPPGMDFQCLLLFHPWRSRDGGLLEHAGVSDGCQFHWFSGYDYRNLFYCTCCAVGTMLMIDSSSNGTELLSSA